MENLFPFANVATTDPFTGSHGQPLREVPDDQHVPARRGDLLGERVLGEDGSLLHTTPDGSADLPESPFSAQLLHVEHAARHRERHVARELPAVSESAELEPGTARAVPRARQVVDRGVAPPPSRVPKLADGTMALPANTHFPTNIPDPFGQTPNGKVTYTGLKSPRYRYPVGESFYTSGIPTTFPMPYTPPYEINASVPTITVNGPLYPSFAPVTDATATTLRACGCRTSRCRSRRTRMGAARGPQANDGCESSGQFIPFPATAAARAASGDPRPSVAERYPTFADYDNKAIAAINQMIQDRTELCEDSAAELSRMRNLGAAEAFRIHPRRSHRTRSRWRIRVSLPRRRPSGRRTARWCLCRSGWLLRIHATSRATSPRSPVLTAPAVRTGRSPGP
jgi:hypothetical protein